MKATEHEDGRFVWTEGRRGFLDLLVHPSSCGGGVSTHLWGGVEVADQSPCCLALALTMSALERLPHCSGPQPFSSGKWGIKQPFTRYKA